MEYRKTKKRSKEKSMELTGDLITEIISRVPAKDLIRFTCVSKSWFSFIYTDTHLSRLQFDRTASTDRPFVVISKSCNYWFDLESIDDANAKLEQIHNPWINEDRNALVVGSCHGLLVLKQQPSGRIAVSNPTTKKHHMVPPNPAGDGNVRVMGFGYDQVHCSYKLVTRVIPTSRDDHTVELMIYDLNKGAWRKSKFDDLDDDYYSPSFGIYVEKVYVDGALYWRNKDIYYTEGTEGMKIIRFVLAEEEFEEVEPPKFGDVIMYEPNMAVFDGRLCLICQDYSKPNCKYTMEFWQLGSSYPSCWTIFLSIQNPESLLPYNRRFSIQSLIPITFSACENKILLIADKLELFWYDLGKIEFVELENPTNTLPIYVMNGVTCVRSLIGSGIF